MARSIQVLLVEDDLIDATLTQEAVRKVRGTERLHVVADGEQAIAFLRKQGEYGDVPTPDLILLDLRLPRRDGCEVLEEIKTDEWLRRIPVVVLTTSSSHHDIMKSYGLKANCCVTKPIEPGQFIAVIQSIRDFWLTTATLPSGSAAG